MNERFNSSGSFVRPVAAPAVGQAAPITVAPEPQKNSSVTNALDLTNEETGGKKSKKKNSTTKAAPEIEFEGNRLGISPLTLGLLIGIALIVYSAFQSVKNIDSMFNFSSGEIREYKRQIRPMDLPGR
jgi:hypothetical protein